MCYLKFDGNLKDSSGHKNNGKAKGGTVTYTADRFGNKKKALFFGNSGLYIEIPDADFDGLAKATFSVDFYSTSTTTVQQLVSKMDYAVGEQQPGFYESLGLGLRNNQVGFGIREDGYCDTLDRYGWTTAYANTPFTINTWNNVTATFTNTIQKIYLNGVLVSAVSKTFSPICGDEPIRLGIWWQQGPQFFTGTMDEVRIYNRALTEAEVKALSKL